MLTSQQRAHLSSIGRLGGLAASAVVDTKARAQSAQSAFRQRFTDGHSCSVCPPVAIPDHLAPEERSRRADALYRAHFSRLARV